FDDGWMDIEPSVLRSVLIATAALSASLALKVNDRTDNASLSPAGSARSVPAAKRSATNMSVMRFKVIGPPEACRRRSSPRWHRWHSLSELRRSLRSVIDT